MDLVAGWIRTVYSFTCKKRFLGSHGRNRAECGYFFFLLEFSQKFSISSAEENAWRRVRHCSMWILKASNKKGGGGGELHVEPSNGVQRGGELGL